MDNLIVPEHVSGRNTRTGRANIERLRELNKLDTRDIRCTQKDGDLQPDSRGPTALHLIQVLTFLKTFAFHSGAS
jgi:hypothetical protein